MPQLSGSVQINEIGPVNAIQQLPYAGITGTRERRTFVDTKLCSAEKLPNYELEVKLPQRTGWSRKIWLLLCPTTNLF